MRINGEVLLGVVVNFHLEVRFFQIYHGELLTTGEVCEDLLYPGQWVLINLKLRIDGHFKIAAHTNTAIFL